MMELSDGRKSFPTGLAVLIQYRSVTDTQPPSHVAVAITLNAQASSLKSSHKRADFSRIALGILRDFDSELTVTYDAAC